MKTPYLVQRAEIQTPLADMGTRLSQAVSFDYMGSAEFEFGALPQSFRRIEAKADSWVCRLVLEIKDGESPLRVYSALSDAEFEQYKLHLIAMRENKLRLKESTYFDTEHSKHFKRLRADFWWDIENDVMFGFHKQFMNRLPHYVAASLAYMNERKA